MINNHYPQQGGHQQQSTVMTNIFHLSEAQSNVSIGVNSFLIILKVTGHDRGSDRKPAMVINMFPSSESLITVVFI